MKMETHLKLWDITKAALRRKSLAKSTHTYLFICIIYIKYIYKRFQSKNLKVQHREPDRQEQTKPQITKKNESTKVGKNKRKKDFKKCKDQSLSLFKS